jgi:phytoene/squalene synthetase
MKSLYDNLCDQISKLTTQVYSTSFSLGILFLDARIRRGIYAVYGYVRLADEIVDSFGGYDQRFLLEKFREETYDSLRRGISVNPVLHSFQETVRRYNISESLIESFLRSMSMDLHKIEYDREKYDRYILGSAEVVGLMCLHVFTEGNMILFEELRPYAMKLGAAFQKVNFLRDLHDDYKVLGRTYFPNVDIDNFDGRAKAEIESEIAEDFETALLGIRKLPPGSRNGVHLAYVYYKSLFDKIRKLPPNRLLAGRVRINNGKKLRLMVNTYLFRRLVNF